jgi:competence protein ComFC
VPMQPSRERERGYNQAELLAQVVARESGIPFRRDLLAKAKSSERQSQLARSERAANVRGKFKATDEAKGLKILLVDDICTTGETLNACAKELLKNRAEKVCALVVARA